MDFSQIEKNLNYTFNDKNLLKRALTLASADGVENNDALEFLGDAILEIVVSDKIFDIGAKAKYLTKRRQDLVSDEALRPISEKLGLDKALIRSTGDTTNKKAIPSAYEAVVAAIYLDGGMDAARKFINETLDFNVSAAANFKGELQERLQDCPDYDECTFEIGNEHNHRFRTELPLLGQVFIGEGDTKQDAQKQAAKAALTFMNSENK